MKGGTLRAGRPTRREFLRQSLLAGGALVGALDHLRAVALGQAREAESARGGRKLGQVEFTGEARVPMDTPFGEELDGRLYTDLTQVTQANLLTPTDAFYIRTRASQLLDTRKPWSVRVGSATGRPYLLTVEELGQMAQPMGAHLMECAGNARAVHFGLMSAARWTGVPVEEVLARAKAATGAGRVLISGFDRYATPSVSSIPGASWIFTIDQLRRAGSFLATGMNGQPLTRDHGAPVRLVAPGWYGCACIKWVNEITIVDDGAAATSQMREYASRTMQDGVPKLARDYQPATIDQAAMPIRVEKWLIEGKIRYRVMGILWGGSQPGKRLEIRFNPEEDYVAVDSFHQIANDPWSFWTHLWTPNSPGSYIIRLRVADPGVRTRRLDAGAYTRAVEITDL